MKKSLSDYLKTVREMSEGFMKDMTPEEEQNIKKQIETLVQEDKSDTEIVEALGKRPDGQPYSQYLHSIKPFINQARLQKHGEKGNE